jgi:hypothetical protein
MDVIGKHLYNSVGLYTAFTRHVHHVEVDGFSFLNSDINDVNLNQIAELRVEVHSNREDVIIENIYKYA